MRTAWLAWVACAVTLIIAAARLILAIVDPASSDAASAPGVPGGGVPVATFEALVLSALAVIGAVVAFRRPQNPVGWILCTIPLFLGVVILGSHAYWSLELGNVGPSSARELTAWVASWIWIPAMVPALTLFPLLYPSGRPPTPRWRWALWAALAACPALFVGQALTPGLLDEYPVTNPLGADGMRSVVDVIGGVGTALMFVAIVGSVASLVVRFRRSYGEERQQIKWVAAAAVLSLVFFFFPVDELAGDDVGFALLLVGLLVVAVAVAISVLRYRLYDIDIVINKSLVFVVLAAFITAVYAAIVVGLGRLLPIGDNNLGLAIAATALVAVAFEPVRVRVQHLANRLVYGRRATPYEALAAMTSRIGEATDPDEALAEAARLLADGTGASQAVVWIVQEGRLLPRGTAGDATGDPEPVHFVDGDLPTLPGTDLAHAVRQDGELVGALSLRKRPGEGVSSADRRLVDELAGQAALLLANARLRARLTDRLGELRASRQRMLAAQDRARHALERDLHDGAQQELVALKIKLGLAGTIATREGVTAVAAGLAQSATVADQAVDTLRDVARGIYPPLLETEGLAAALSAQARRADLSATVLDRAGRRYPREVEATAYFCAVEALQNAVRHAHASNAHVELDGTDSSLTVVVTDDGAGFNAESTTYGTGLTHMTDRVDSVGGSLHIASRPGHGTTVTITLPAVSESGTPAGTPNATLVEATR